MPVATQVFHCLHSPLDFRPYVILLADRLAAWFGTDQVREPPGLGEMVRLFA